VFELTLISFVTILKGGQALIDKEQGAILDVIKKDVAEAEKMMDNRFGFVLFRLLLLSIIIYFIFSICRRKEI
jgi:hypothetical protein